MDIREQKYLILDFETTTPKGHSPEPIEIGAMKIKKGFEIDYSFQYSKLIGLPGDLEVTKYDTAQNGIKTEDIKGKPLPEVIFKEFDGLLGEDKYIVIAQNATYESAIVQRFSSNCPKLASFSFVDTISLAKGIGIRLASFGLSDLASYLDLEIPNGRHRALPDVELTAKVFMSLVKKGEKSGKLTSVFDLKRLAQIQTKTSSSVEDKKSQMSIF